MVYRFGECPFICLKLTKTLRMGLTPLRTGAGSVWKWNTGQCFDLTKEMAYCTASFAWSPWLCPVSMWDAPGLRGRLAGCSPARMASPREGSCCFSRNILFCHVSVKTLSNYPFSWHVSESFRRAFDVICVLSGRESWILVESFAAVAEWI